MGLCKYYVSQYGYLDNDLTCRNKYKGLEQNYRLYVVYTISFILTPNCVKLSKKIALHQFFTQIILTEKPLTRTVPHTTAYCSWSVYRTKEVCHPAGWKKRTSTSITIYRSHIHMEYTNTNTGLKYFLKQNIHSYFSFRHKFNSPTVKNDLAFIKINFSGLIQAITNLEDTKLTLVQSLEIMKNIISGLTNIQGGKGSIIKTKITQLHQKNKGLQVMEQIGLIISDNNEIQLPENFNPCSVANKKYAPLTSVDV
ncbi:hypothetical protein QTP88_008991 [Uroleucon formosanum]